MQSMSTPTTQDAEKSVRVTADVHARLQRLSTGLHNASMNDTIDWLLNPGMVRLSLTEAQRERWKQAAADNGMDVANFAVARVEAALMYGADPGVLRRLYDVTHQIARIAGIDPVVLDRSARQVITERPGK